MKGRSITSQKLATQLVRLLRRSDPPAPPRSLRGWRSPCQGWGACPREIERKPSLRCTPRWSSTCSTTRPSLGVAQTCLRLRKASEEMGRLIGPPLPPSPTGLPSRVDSQLGSVPQGQPVCDHLDPSSIEAIESSHVEVAHQGVWGHPSPSLAAHLGCSTLKRKPPLS